MINIKEYVFPQNIDEAYEYLISKKNTTVFGGGAFIKMGSKNIALAIDLSKIDLNYIKEDDNNIEIGAMTTFGDIERSGLLSKYFNNTLSKSVREIVGVQFRNIVTVGATVYSRYGFSDLITGLLALNTKVKLYKQGVITLKKFLEEGSKERDILEKIIIEKDNRKATFKSMRNSNGDYAILNVAVSKLDDKYKIAVGARPGRGILAYRTMKYLNGHKVTEETLEKACEILTDEIEFGTNKRGSKEYRKGVSKTLVKRCIMEVIKDEN
ncbi:FAD binding domain-containing protein [Dethiothermospora halolimnae]|uniref:FAD binding domain-containing protein n=1 Tax=Dethiothermospora halolimnae TaxID=3114390 RepID=UPI003CCC1884